MRTRLFTLLLMLLGLFTFAQKANNVKVEKAGNMYKVTYFHNNGLISQTGYVTKDFKNQGVWESFNESGDKVAVGQYENGKKVGEWMFYGGNSVTEVTYNANSTIASVQEYTISNTHVALQDE